MEEIDDNVYYYENKNKEGIKFSIQDKNKQFVREKKLIKEDELNLCLIDIDYTIGYDERIVYKEKTYNNIKAPIIKLFALDEEQTTYFIKVKNFLPYFYIKPYSSFELNQENLDKLIKKIKSINTLELIGEIIDIEIVEKESILYYNENKKETFLKIICTIPQDVVKLRNIFEKEEFNQPVALFDSITFESSLPFTMRFLVDKGISGMSWFKINNFENINKPNTHCLYNFEINHFNILKQEINKIPPLRIFSFDIECFSENGFPEPEINPIITIGVTYGLHNENKKNGIIFQLKKCSSISNVEIRCYEEEWDMLMDFENFLLSYDPDIIMGYNISTFDLNYLINRIKHLKKNYKIYWCREKSRETLVNKATLNAKGMMNRNTFEIITIGRIQFDLFQIILREKNFTSYSLNNVSYEILKEHKEDVAISMIPKLQKGSNEDRKRIASYCLKDSELPIKLFDKLKLIFSQVEMARVTGVTISYLFNRGQQIKVLSQLYNFTKNLDIIVPNLSRFSNNKNNSFQGAYVLEPKTGLYESPVATLDFSSLYPSIMIAHNLCYTTLINSKEMLEKLNKEDVTEGYEKTYFVKSHVRKGILPMILTNLLENRKKVKNQISNIEKELEKEKDIEKIKILESDISVLNGRQLALKISANSVYGFTGAQVGQLTCLEISSTVTYFGRNMINFTKNKIEEIFNEPTKYKTECSVIYGDTDSVMINFKDLSLKDSIEYSKYAAEIISKQFINPINILFEKVYYPYLLIGKKRYSGLLYTNSEHWDKKDTKGLENVRRDNCLLVRITLERVLDILLKKKNIEKAVNYVKSVINDLINNRIDISYLIISKGLNRSVDNENEEKNYKVNLPHVALAKKLKVRDPNNYPKQGDRVPYIIIQGLSDKVYENAEDPLYAFKNQKPIDINYYLNNQLKPPLKRIFDALFIKKNIFSVNNVKNLTLQKVSKEHGWGKFFQTTYKCLSCNITISSKNPVCKNCEDKTIEVYSKKLMNYKLIQNRFGYFWNECQRCIGKYNTEILCNNFDCSIFYKRLKAQRDLKDLTIEIERFN